MPAEPTLTTPTSIEEYRRLANAFLTGSRFPAGTVVYVIASTAGTRPIQDVIWVSSPTANQEVATALENSSPSGFTPGEASARVTYRVTVPAVDRLSKMRVVLHGSTGSDLAPVLPAGAALAAPPEGASLGDIASAELHITWTNGRGTSAYRLDPRTDAVFLTRGAFELFALTVYQAMYGSDYVAIVNPI